MNGFFNSSKTHLALQEFEACKARSSQYPIWFHVDITEGLKSFYQLGLSPLPEYSQIKARVALWLDALEPYSKNQEKNQQRIRAAFKRARGELKHFPVPAEFKELIPAHQLALPLESPRGVRPSERKQGKRRSGVWPGCGRSL